MAITSFDTFFDKNAIKSSCSKSSNLNKFNSMKIDYTTNSSLTSSHFKHNKCKIDKYISPYLSEDRVQLLSRVTEKRFLHKDNDFMSSFPLAANIYRANSDEFRSSKRCGKKVKKSVLTLPNEAAPLPHACTVSEMNDSEYFNDDKDDLRPTLRKATQNKKKSHLRNRKISLCNTDVKYCSKLDIQMDKNSKDIINKLADDKGSLRKTQKNNNRINSDFKAHDVWSLLRKADHFQFRPSPPLSQESSIISVKKNKRRKNRQRSNRKDSRLIETRTEEYAYITSIVDNPQNSCSLSSFDRITVIEKQDHIQTIRNEIAPVEFDKSSVPFVFHCENAKTQNFSRSKKSKPKQCRNKINNSERCREQFSNNKPFVAVTSQKNNVTSKSGDKEQQINEMEFKNNIEDNKNNFIQINLNNEINMTQTEQCNDIEFNCSEKSDSSKEDLKKKRDSSKKNYEYESKQHITGITKVVLSKGQNILLTKQSTASKQDFLRKSRILTTKPVASVLPKINHRSMKVTEIKRKLNSIKYPLVILGKDQLRSIVTCDNYNPPQFAGLDEHIWPYMQNWYATDNPNVIDSIISNVNNKYQSLNVNNEYTNICSTNNSVKDSKVQNFISKNKYNELLLNKQITPIDRTDNSSKKSLTHIKPMHRIKNKMMRLIHKKHVPENDLYNNNDPNEVSKRSLVDVGTNTMNNLLIPKQVNILPNRDFKISKNMPTSNNNVKTKGKWASDFIENVIRKIKNGVYYYQDDKDKFKDEHKNTKEDGAQTEIEQPNSQIVDLAVDNHAAVDEISVTEEMDSILTIPGFDNRLSGLEIESLNNFNQVAVKHCMANVIIQFDVSLSFESNRILQIKQSYPCIPITLIKNEPTIFKCQTTIINAKLPAELCSILPKLIKKIMKCNPNSALPTSAIDKVTSNLSTISEIIPCPNSDPKRYIMSAPIDYITKTKVAIEGQISSTHISKCMSRRDMQIKYLESFDFMETNKLLTTIKMNLLSFDHINQINLLNYFIKPKPSLFQDIVQIPKIIPTCTALQSYDFSSKMLLDSRDNYSFMRIVEIALGSKHIIFNLKPSFNNMLKELIYKTPVNISFETTNKSDINVLHSPIPYIDITYADLQNVKRDQSENVNNIALSVKELNPATAKTAKIECLEAFKPKKLKSGAEFCINNTRNKKRGFVKLYKKCKSMSSISGTKSSTTLNKITNLEEFCLALGSGKMLSGVIDGNAERKILSAVNEMKNWINEITPGQALLVLLLANKKDTPNLVRYRPIILQGIAVNRITRVSELDMEIEVIERENLNKLIQYEGITYVPASEENQDSLLEELYWIAKTTASDYNKPFDESSERLLKSLLIKRKKLNPSYLRVMARYVGLGLLKASK